MACARCHDHKFDPIPTKDYYALAGVFASTDYEEVPLVPQAVVEEAKRKLTDAEKKKNGPPTYPFVHALKDGPHPVNMKVHIRGNPQTLGDEVPRHFLSILGGQGKPFTKGSGRLELAEAIASGNNPLTARVMVNRVWQHHFGRGLVRTPSNFGALGERPTHPELLDYLAQRFIQSGWSIKALHRTDHVVGHVSAEQPARSVQLRSGSREQAALAYEPAPSGGRGLERCHAGGSEHFSAYHRRSIEGADFAG